MMMPTLLDHDETVSTVLGEDVEITGTSPALREGSRWDGNVHYFDYKADTVRPDTTRIEGYVVAEAFIYDHTRTSEKVAIAVLVTSEELEVEKLPREEAIRLGEAIRNQAVANHRAKLPGGHRTVVFNLRGHQIETKEE